MPEMGQEEEIIAFQIALKKKVLSFSASQRDGEYLNVFLLEDITVNINKN